MTRDRLQALLCKELERNLAAQDTPRIPAGGNLLWRWFNDLAASRTWHASGANPVSYAEIEAYARLHRLPVRPDHVAALRAMDETYLRVLAARRQDVSSGVKTLPPKSGPITGGLFDVMFG